MQDVAEQKCLTQYSTFFLQIGSSGLLQSREEQDVPNMQVIIVIMNSFN